MPRIRIRRLLPAAILRNGSRFLRGAGALLLARRRQLQLFFLIVAAFFAVAALHFLVLASLASLRISGSLTLMLSDPALVPFAPIQNAIAFHILYLVVSGIARALAGSAQSAADKADLLLETEIRLSVSEAEAAALGSSLPEASPDPNASRRKGL